MIEIRSAGTLSGTGRRVAGYAAVFDSPADLGAFTEVIRPGAFTTSLRDNAIRALYGHDDAAILGTTRAKTLQLRSDAKGLAFELELPDTSTGRDVAELVKRGDVAGCSFGFVTRSDKWTEGQKPLRELLDVDLREITLTASPAYPDTSVAMRSLEKAAGHVSPLRLWLETV